MSFGPWMRNMPITRKLMVIGLLTSGFALLAVSLILAVRDVVEWRSRTVADLRTIASIIGTDVASAMVFDDRRAAERTLESLAQKPDITHAILYDLDGKLFATYTARKVAREHPLSVPVEPGQQRLAHNYLAVSEPIAFMNETMGVIYLEADIGGLYAGLRRDILLIFLIALGTLAVTLMMFARLRHGIVDPLLGLVQAMQSVSRDQAYNVRMKVQSGDETGLLSQTFNTMLDQIQSRDQELADHRTNLERMVAERTAELSDANENLERELIERIRAESALKESEQKFRALAEDSPNTIFILKYDRLVYVNKMGETIAGYSREEMVSQEFDFMRLIAPVSQEAVRIRLRQYMHGESFPPFECILATRNGTQVPVIIATSLITYEGESALLGIVTDVTERKRAEEVIQRMNEQLEQKVQERTKELRDAQEELVRKEKLSVLGQVAGSVGHELRNPLGVMNNAVYFLQTVLTNADDTTKEYLDIIKNEIGEADRIVGDLLDSVRTKPPHPVPVSVDNLIEQTLKKLTVPDKVKIELAISAGLPLLQVDPLQMQQVFRNLITNGMDAMLEGGTLTISAETAPGDAVAVKVTDTGTGIAPEQMAHLFQPLFTTKAKGVGLGLVVIKNLTQANGGKVEVQTKPGKGTTFTITMPTGSTSGGAS